MSPNSPAKSPRVLYVDDEAPALKYFDRMFADEFSIVTALNAADARKLLDTSEEPIGVLLTDQRMPGEQGVDLLDYARRHHPLTVRILTTAFSDLPSAIAAVNTGGAYQYVTKPWDFDALRILLRQALDLFQLRVSHDELLAQKAYVWQQLSHNDANRGLLGLCAAAERWNPRALQGLLDYSQAARGMGSEGGDNAARSLSVAASGAAELEFLVELARLINEVTPRDPLAIKELGARTILQESIERFQRMETPEGVHISAVELPPDVSIVGDHPRLVALISLLLGRISNLDGDDLNIQIDSGVSSSDHLSLSLTARNKTWPRTGWEPLFSAIDVSRLDRNDHALDLLPAFLMAAELHIALEVITPSPGLFGGFLLTIPRHHAAPATTLTASEIADKLMEQPDDYEHLIPTAE